MNFIKNFLYRIGLMKPKIVTSDSEFLKAIKQSNPKDIIIFDERETKGKKEQSWNRNIWNNRYRAKE